MGRFVGRAKNSVEEGCEAGDGFGGDFWRGRGLVEGMGWDLGSREERGEEGEGDGGKGFEVDMEIEKVVGGGFLDMKRGDFNFPYCAREKEGLTVMHHQSTPYHLQPLFHAPLDEHPRV